MRSVELVLIVHWASSTSYAPRLLSASYPDVSLSLDENVRAKESGKETMGLLYPSHGPLQFITSHIPCEGLAKNEAPEEEAGLLSRSIFGA